jgi:hypothetical protein
MPPVFRRRLVAVVLGVVATMVVAVGAAMLVVGPRALGSLWAVARFKLDPGRARTDHLLRLRGPSGERVVLLGTTHHHLFTHVEFSIWHVKAAFLALAPDALLLEMLPDAAAGDGPVEMPFLRALAHTRGTPVCGVDATWDGGWRARQDRMFRQALTCLQRTLPTTATTTTAATRPPTALLVTGYLHTRPFLEQFTAAGYAVEPWTDGEKQALLEHPITPTLPPGYRAALQASLDAALVRAHASGGDEEPWDVVVRRRVLERVRPFVEDR